MWKCKKCGKLSERLEINWGVCSGRKVDILDYFCPHCPSDELEFLGTEEEREAYWDMEFGD